MPASPPKPPLKKPTAPRASLTGESYDKQLQDFNRQSGQQKGSAGAGTRLVSTPTLFRDLSDLDLPDSLKGLFQACRYLSQWSAVHKAFVGVMSTFPVTNIVVKNPSQVSHATREASVHSPGISQVSDDRVTNRMRDLIEQHWKLRDINKRAGRAYWTYSNAVISILYPFEKRLTCTGKNCTHMKPAINAEWELRPRGEFWWKCPECGKHGQADVHDAWLPIPEDTRLQVLDMERIDAYQNEFTGDVDLYYEIPEEVVERINGGDKSFIIRTPQAYLEAALGKTPRYRQAQTEVYAPRVKLRRDTTYLMRAPTLPQGINGLAFPEMAATMKDYWLFRMLQKQQEAIASDHIVPLRVIYPEASRTSGNLFEMISIPSYMEVLRKQVSAQRIDPNHIPIVPFPIGYEQIGGDGKALMLSQEMRVLMEMQTSGLGAPLEMIFGGLSYSGSSVSIKQQEAKFADFRAMLLDMNRWAVRQISYAFKLPQVTLEHEEFRMGDDLSYLQMLMSAQTAGVVSLTRVHREMGVDSRTEREEIKTDVEFQSTLNELRMKSDAGAQEQMMLRQTAAQAAGTVMALEAELDKRMELQKKVRNDPELYQLVQSDPNVLMSIFGAGSPEAAAAGAAASQIPMTPNPEEIAPSAPQSESKHGEVSVTPEHLGSYIRGYMRDIQAEQAQPQQQAQPGDYYGGADYTQDQIDQLATMFGNIEPSDWGTQLSHIRDEFGEDIARQVFQKVMMGQMLATQAPEQNPATSRRPEYQGY